MIFRSIQPLHEVCRCFVNGHKPEVNFVSKYTVAIRGYLREEVSIDDLLLN